MIWREIKPPRIQNIDVFKLNRLATLRTNFALKSSPDHGTTLTTVPIHELIRVTVCRAIPGRPGTIHVSDCLIDV